MEQRTLRYLFESVEICNMCGSSRNAHRILGKRLNTSQGLFPRRRKRGITTTIMRCLECGLIFPDPLPIPFDLQDHYGVPPEDYWKAEYFKVPDDYFSGVIQRFKCLAPFRPGMTALDIGAGLGKAMIALGRGGFETYGFEPSGSFRNRAIESMGIDPNRIRLGGIQDVTYEAGSFDFITFGAVLEHLYNPSSSIQKALAWLKPGGLIHIEVPSSNWLISRIANWIYWAQGSDYVANVSPMHTPFHLYEFTLNAFRANGRRLGYEVAYHQHMVCDTYAPPILDLPLLWYMKRTNTGMQLAVWLRKAKSA